MVLGQLRSVIGGGGWRAYAPARTSELPVRIREWELRTGLAQSCQKPENGDWETSKGLKAHTLLRELH